MSKEEREKLLELLTKYFVSKYGKEIAEKHFSYLAVHTDVNCLMRELLENSEEKETSNG